MQLREILSLLKTPFRYCSSSPSHWSAPCKKVARKGNPRYIGRVGSSIPCPEGQVHTASIWTSATKIIEYQVKYSVDEQNQILEKINQGNEGELAQYSVSKGRAKNILRYRKKHGILQSIDEILEVEGFGVRVMERFFESILKRDISAEGENHLQFCSPRLGQDEIKDMKSIVGLQVTVGQMSWAHIHLDEADESNRCLLSWDTFPLLVPGKKTSNIDMLKLVIEGIRKLPQAQVYVMEERPMRGIQPAYFPFHLQLNQLHAFLFALLNKNIEHRGAPSLVYMKPVHVSKLFNLQVGKERVSGQSLLEDIVSKTCTSAQTQIDLLPHLWDEYKIREPTEKELLCMSLFNGHTVVSGVIDLTHVHPNQESGSALPVEVVSQSYCSIHGQKDSVT
ncbi:unnamed protein product [Darwinula stevensoni]|uniref:Transcription elongation factor, mitochondrial n=1 Tax=Darwinula stevensoni TaxID=69355 RepID=A0A7R8X6L4_9CRUS|nr:unnamed protein product [Darwinula stevensoni]CAG0881602.1 unnamed protein product [Darwinula stevensoni]